MAKARNGEGRRRGREVMIRRILRTREVKNDDHFFDLEIAVRVTSDRGKFHVNGVVHTRCLPHEDSRFAGPILAGFPLLATKATEAKTRHVMYKVPRMQSDDFCREFY